MRFTPVKDRQGLKYTQGLEAYYRTLVQNANTVLSLVVDYRRHAERPDSPHRNQDFSTLQSFRINFLGLDSQLVRNLETLSK